jgi:hypothetical protein
VDRAASEPGATREQAQADLTALGRRAAADFPEANAHLRARVLRFAVALGGVQGLTLSKMAQVHPMSEAFERGIVGRRSAVGRHLRFIPRPAPGSLASASTRSPHSP